MRLDQRAREYWKLSIATEPEVTAWEASFDDGATWVAATDDGDGPVWLVAGPGFDPDSAEPAAYTTLTKSVAPLLRAVDNPELIIRRAPRIHLS